MKKLSLIVSLLGLCISLNAQLVISEIFYDAPNSGSDSLEFIEIYNKGNAAINVKGFVFSRGIRDTLPDVSIAAKAFYVVTNNSVLFKQKFGKDARQWIGSDALSNSGETIEIKNAAGILVDSVRYDDVAPWPTTPKGSGASLVLCDLNADNDNVANWSACTVASSAKIANVQLFVTPLADNCTGGNVVSAVVDNINVSVNKPIKIAVLRNDIFTKPVQISATTAPSNGTIFLNAKKDTVTYTPTKDFCGNDKFTYTISDGTLSSTADVNLTVSGCSAAIKDLKTVNANGEATNINKTYEISGVVNGPSFRPNGIELPIIDAAGDGIIVFSNNKTFNYTVKEGDLVTAKGRLTQFNGLIQLTLDTIFYKGAGMTSSPKIVTKLDETTEAQIITLKNVQLVDATKWVPATNGFNVEVTNGISTFTMRVDADTDLYNQPAPTGKFDITGVGYQFDNSSPFTEGYQINPRYAADLKKIIATNDLSLGKEIQLYPNPVNDNLTITMGETMDKIIISDVVGKVILAIWEPAMQQTINTSNWKSGIYIISFQKEGRQYTTKLVK
jgi:hypothetical protein